MRQRTTSTTTPKGNAVSFVDHPELRTHAKRKRFILAGEELVSNGRELTQNDETVLFQALHACGKDLSIHESGSRRRAKTAIGRDAAARLHKRLLDALIERNLGLVYEMLRRSPFSGVDREDLISEGLWTLFRAIASFNPWRGYRFSTYACTSILRGFILLAKKKRRDREQKARLIDQFDPTALETREEIDLDTQVAIDRLRRVLEDNQAGLTAMERFVLERRILHPKAQKPETLAKVGKLMKLSKERVRQLQIGALAKLRLALSRDGIGIQSLPLAG